MITKVTGTRNLPRHDGNDGEAKRGFECGKKVPDLNRYSRHYYDVHQIWTHPAYGKTTASMLDLAEPCRHHKELMFRAPAAASLSYNQ
jgi:hypothetical protein